MPVNRSELTMFGRAAGDDCRLCTRRMRGLRGGDERRAYMRNPHPSLRRGTEAGRGSRPPRPAAVEPFADLMDQRERATSAQRARPRRRRPRSARRRPLDRFPGVAVVDDVVQSDPAPAVDRVVELGPRAERGGETIGTLSGAAHHVGFEPVVRTVDDWLTAKSDALRDGSRSCAANPR